MKGPNQKKNPEVDPENEADLEDEVGHAKEVGHENGVGLENEVEVAGELEVGQGDEVGLVVVLDLPSVDQCLLKWFPDGRGTLVRDVVVRLSRDTFANPDRDRRSLERSSGIIENAEDKKDELLRQNETDKLD